MDAPHDADRAHAKLAESASTLKDSAVQQVDSADRRTELAADRTILAGERTYAAWVRTGLAALASGIGARALLKDVVFPWLATATGTMLILFSAFCFVAAVLRTSNSRIAGLISAKVLPSRSTKGRPVESLQAVT